MKSICISLVFCLLSFVSPSQNFEMIRKKSDSLNYCIELSYKISPWSDSVITPDTGILFFHPKIPMKGWKMIDSLNTIAEILIEELFLDPGFVKYRADTMIQCRSIVSADKDIAVYSWYTNNGGTWKVNTNYIAIIYNNSVDLMRMGTMEEIICGGTGWPMNLIPVPSQKDTIWLLVQFTRGCGSCFEYSVFSFQNINGEIIPYNAFILESDSLNCYSVAPFSIYPKENIIDYSNKNKTLSIEYNFRSNDGKTIMKKERWKFDGISFRLTN